MTRRSIDPQEYLITPGTPLLPSFTLAFLCSRSTQNSRAPNCEIWSFGDYIQFNSWMQTFVQMINFVELRLNVWAADFNFTRVPFFTLFSLPILFFFTSTYPFNHSSIFFFLMLRTFFYTNPYGLRVTYPSTLWREALDHGSSDSQHLFHPSSLPIRPLPLASKCLSSIYPSVDLGSLNLHTNISIEALGITSKSDVLFCFIT